eukprot:403347617
MGRAEVVQAVFSARCFYFGCYTLFYGSCFIYPNDLYDYFKSWDIFNILFFIGLHLVSIYFFLFSYINPGYLDETETEFSRKQKAKLFVGYDDFKTVAETDVEAIQDSFSKTNDPNSNNDLENNNNSAYINDNNMSVLSDDNARNKHSRSFDKMALHDTKDSSRSIESSNQHISSLEHIARIELPLKKFCEYCNLEQPYRTKHCKECERCVRKFDHHCFWIGGCVGELNHRKFWAFLFFQTTHFCLTFNIAMSGYARREENQNGDKDQANHIGSVWVVFQTLSFIFILFAGCLLFYHTYLIMSGQTTWEHSRRGVITYLKIYPTGILPFYQGIVGNIKKVFRHQNQCTEWELLQPYELRERQGFNLCENEVYSCC